MSKSPDRRSTARQQHELLFIKTQTTQILKTNNTSHAIAIGRSKQQKQWSIKNTKHNTSIIGGAPLNSQLSSNLGHLSHLLGPSKYPNWHYVIKLIRDGSVRHDIEDFPQTSWLPAHIELATACIHVDMRSHPGEVRILGSQNGDHAEGLGHTPKPLIDQVLTPLSTQMSGPWPLSGPGSPR